MNSQLHLEVSVDDQQLSVRCNGEVLHQFQISTAEKGVGFQAGSNRTPTGSFRIADKIGAGAPLGTIFKSRESVGIWHPEQSATEDDLILTRILRIEGLDAQNSNTYERFIYLHGTNQENLLGTPCSHGCIRLSNEDIITLFDLVEPGTPLTILPPTRSRGKLFFFDCDSTLSTIEGIDELARARGQEVFEAVVALTDAAMNGTLPLDGVFPARMDIIRPDRAACEAVARQYVETITPGAQEWVTELKANGWIPIILSGGFAPLIEPLAKELGIKHVEAVPLYLNEDGSYAGFAVNYPTTRNGGKSEIIREWKAALLPDCTAMMGDGISDLETKPDVDVFIGYGEVACRAVVKQGADLWVDKMSELSTIKLGLNRNHSA